MNTRSAVAEAFDVFGCPLAGIRLIEASAGTGKTWNLCGLYLRLLLERGLDVQHILVVTFTHAATAELRERIRSRIVETLAFLDGQGVTGGDPFVPRLIATLRAATGLADDEMTRRLDLALQTFDEAAIYTIHGYCQRALADTPFSAQVPLALETVQDDAEFIAEAANDFWRRRVAGDMLDPALAAWLVRRKDSPAKFAKLLQRHLAKPLALTLWPAEIDTPGAIDGAALQAAHAAARALWQAQRDDVVRVLEDALPQLNKATYKPEALRLAAAGWDALLADPAAANAPIALPDKTDLFGSTLLEAKVKKNCPAPEHAFFGAAQRLLDLRAAAERTLALLRLALLRDLLAEGGLAVRQAKRQRRVVAFDDMLFNLHERLTNGSAPWLAASLRARFPAALIDEFQDTDPLQFAIFDHLYGSGEFPLFLVGDPKQAIYSFRNADLHTYLQARARATAEYTLAANQRASEALIDAQNGLFGANERAFMLDGLHYRQVGFGDKPRKPFDDCTAPRAPLQVWQLPQGDGPLPKKEAQLAAATATAGEIARLLAAAQRGEITLDGRPLRAGDIALLVRSHRHGSAMRLALAAVGVGSVELSQASIYASADAEDLDRLLAAVLEPTRERLLKAALATELLGQDAPAIAALAGDEAQLLRWVQRLAAARDTWRARGVGYMLRELMRSADVPERLLARTDGERRLTNLLHLAELLHQAAEAHPAPDALLRWFQAQRRDPRSSDATQLRLESDRNLVQIVTIHKAKGLEYPVVFCPFLWDGWYRELQDGLDGVVYHDDAGQTVIDFRKGLDDAFDEADVKRRRRLDTAAEHLRLIYVALTRAVHRCVLVAGSYTTKTGGGTSTSESARSLLNWLVAGHGMAPQAWFDAKLDPAAIDAAWAALAAACGPALAVAPLPQAPAAPLASALPAPETLAALAPPRDVPAAWWVGSYSALAHGATHAQAALDHDLRAEPVLAAPAAVAARLDEDDFLRFPRGAAAGDCVHAVFERIDFTVPGTWAAHIAEVLRLHRAGLPTTPAGMAETDALRARMLHRLVRDVLATPLPVGTAEPLVLGRVPRARRLVELEFHLPTHRLDDAALNAALAELGYAVPRLGFGVLRGYLKGYIDLVVEHDGRYFVVDWKSNHLGDSAADYAAAPLAAAMREHGYRLQSLLYGVALERLLRQRLAGYDPARHFGGSLYLFVRGLRPGWAAPDGAPAGLVFDRPSPAALRRLSALFDGAEVAA